jgi:proteasome lid subunit RPN8/RPN11
VASRVSAGPVELLIDARVVAALDRELQQAAPRRGSGFLLGDSSGVVVSARAHCPAFGRASATGRLSGADYQRALRQAHRSGYKVVARYRTLPNGDPGVSVTDLAGFRRSRLATLVVTARPNGIQPRLDAYAPPTGCPITVAVGHGTGRELV